MTKKKRFKLCYRQLEELHRHLTPEGKAHMWSQKVNLGISELETMKDILTNHQELVLRTIWSYVK